MLEAVPDALVGMDQKGMIRFVNRQTETLFGYDRDQLIGRHIDILVSETLYAVYAQHRADYFSDPRTRSSGLDLELSARMRDGTDLPVNISMSSIDTGDVLLVITARRDVTRQRRAVVGAQFTAAIVESSDDAMIGATLEGVVTSWNPAAERMYGYSPEEIVGKYAGLLVPDDRADEIQDYLTALRGGQAIQRLKTFRVRRDGTVFPASITMAPIRDGDGAIVGASVTCRDTTEQRRAFEASQREAAIVESSNEAIIGSTLEGVMTSGNPAAERMHGHSAAEVMGKSGKLLSPGIGSTRTTTLKGELQSEVPSGTTAGSPDTFAVVAMLEATRGLLWITSAAEAAALAAELIAALGGTTVSAPAGAGSETIPVDVSFGDGHPLLPAAPQLSVARMLLERHLPQFVLDAQRAVELAEQTSRLAEDASIDALTGLVNKRFLGRVLGRLRAGDTVIMIDLDHFKAVNDRLGPLGGDRVLRALGRTLASTLRATDRAGRYGGDEFVVIIADAGAEAFLTRLQLAWVTARPHPITFSAGIAPAAPTAADPARALEAADRAMYRAKQAGRDQWQWAMEGDYR